MAASFAKAVMFVSVLGVVVMPISRADGDVVHEAAIASAREGMASATSRLGQVMESCESKGFEIQIPRSGELGVSRRSLLLGVGYFHTKRYNECIAPEAKEFLLAARVLETGLSQDGDVKKVREAFELVDIVVEGWWKEFEAEARYRTEVPPADRAKIDGIPGFGRPFDMIRSWNASGN